MKSFFHRSRFSRNLITPLLFLSIGIWGGCSALISPAALRIVDNLTAVVLNNNDLETVKDGAPAYLLMIEGLVESDPENERLLRSAATLYTAYTDIFVKDPERAERLTEKGLDYGLRALAARFPSEKLRDMPFQDFMSIISKTGKKDVPTLFALGAAWASWVQVRKSDWNAVAEISRVEAVMKRVTQLDETFQNGSAHMYLGVMNTFLPPALGGKPEVGRTHFERAIELSGGENLMAKVLFARHYARLTFDRELHDRLLADVAKSNPDAKGYVLSNTLAQQEAGALIESADDYF